MCCFGLCVFKQDLNVLNICAVSEPYSGKQPIINLPEMSILNIFPFHSYLTIRCWFMVVKPSAIICKHSASQTQSERPLTGIRLSSKKQTDVNIWDEGTVVEEHHGGEPQSGPPKEKRGWSCIFSGVPCFLFFLSPPPQQSRKSPLFFFQKTCQISDRQLFSSCMQIPLDSAKPPPRGENFKVGLSVKARGLKKACLCARRLKLSEWDAARGWMTLSAQFLWRLAEKVDVSLCLLKPTTVPKNK